MGKDDVNKIRRARFLWKFGKYKKCACNALIIKMLQKCRFEEMKPPFS